MQQLTYTFKELCGGMPASWRVIQDGFVRRSQAHAYALAWFRDHGYEVIDCEKDEENNAIDFMAAKGNALYQYAVERA